MRHVHPIRQSGPIPPYHGDWNMEDVKKANHGLFAGDEPYPAHTDVEELMRRVLRFLIKAPGLTRKEALKIQSMGFSPLQELDYAYLVVNNGIDVFYQDNNAYLLRQVITKYSYLIQFKRRESRMLIPFK